MRRITFALLLGGAFVIPTQSYGQFRLPSPGGTAKPAVPNVNYRSPQNFNIGGRTNTGFQGNVSNGSRGFSTSGQYSNNRGTSVGGTGAYRSPQNFNIGGNYTAPNSRGQKPTTSGGNLSNGSGGFAAGGRYSDGRSNYGGNLGYQNTRNFNASGNYNQYGGTLSRQNGATNVGGNYSTAGPYGTRINYSGNASIQGRDSRVTGGATVTDPTGRLQFGSGTGVLTRQGYTQTGSAGVGNVRGTQTHDTRFRGANSSYQQTTGANVPGVGSAGYNYGFSRQGASAGAGMNVGGTRIGGSASVTNRGVTLRSTGVNVPSKIPSGTGVKVPPRISTGVKIPSSVPSVSIPGF